MNILCFVGFHNWRQDCEKCNRCSTTRQNAHRWNVCKCAICGKSWNKDFDEAVGKNDLKTAWDLCVSNLDYATRANYDGDVAPLSQAARYACCEIMEALLKASANANVRDSIQNTPLHEVGSYLVPGVAQRAAKACLLLLRYGADIHARNYLGMTPLHSAANTGNTELVETLLRNGADAHARTHRGETPYQYIAGGPERLNAVRAILWRLI